MPEIERIIADLEAVVRASGDALRLQRIAVRNDHQEEQLVALVRIVCGFASDAKFERYQIPEEANIDDVELTYLEALTTTHANCKVLLSTEENDRYRGFLLDIIQDTATEALTRIRLWSWDQKALGIKLRV